MKRNSIQHTKHNINYFKLFIYCCLLTPVIVVNPNMSSSFKEEEQRRISQMSLQPSKKRWNTEEQCLEPDRDPQGKEWGRCGAHPHKWKQWQYDELSKNNQKMFDKLSATLYQPLDYDESVFIIERFILQTLKVIEDYVNFLRSIGFSIKVSAKVLFYERKPSREFLKEGRRRIKYYHNVWWEVRGCVACRLIDEIHHNQKKLENYRVYYMERHGNNVNHGAPAKELIKKDKSKLLFEVMGMVQNKQEAFRTPLTIVSINEWQNIGWDQLERGNFCICPGYIAIYFDLPLTGVSPNGPDMFRDGTIKMANIKSIKKLPVPMISKAEIIKINATNKEQKKTNKVLNDLEDKIETLVK